MKVRSLTRSFSNWLWIRLSTPEYYRFLQTLDNVEEVQHRNLLSLIRLNSSTEYGKRYSFTNLASIEEYQKAVPITNYEHYSSYIEEITQGKQGVLTHEPVLLFEPSSGTSSPSKFIPYTRSLKAEFQRGIAPWFVSLFRRKPELVRGSAYWSISPPIKQKRYFGEIPVGFDEDAEYLGFMGKWLHRQVTAVPQDVTCLADVDVFKCQTLVYLLAAESLALMSVWHPTFLTLLLTHLIDNQDKILWLLKKSRFVGGVKRAEKIQTIMQHEKEDNIFERIWPNLSVISCWTHGPSEMHTKDIQKYFPNVEIQGKGLIATEAFVSLPFILNCDPILAVNSHLFEFIDNKSGNIYLAHEVKEGKVYSVIVSTSGGLYRYRLDDLVRVTGFFHGAPTLRFIAKEGIVSDMFGEKLHADHLQCSAVDAFSRYLIEPLFFLFAPVKTLNEAVAYSLFLDAPDITTEQAENVRDNMEEMLCQNFHYAHCRAIGQLGILKLFLIDRSYGVPEKVYIREMQRRGIKLGDIKPVILDREMGWERCFHGRFLDTTETR